MIKIENLFPGVLFNDDNEKDNAQLRQLNMKPMINIAKILENAEYGKSLWSDYFGCYVKFDKVDYNCELPIFILLRNNTGREISHAFNKYGQADNNVSTMPCTLFPSKENRDWNKFKVSYTHKHFSPFQKVLIGLFIGNTRYWKIDLYSHFDEEMEGHCTLSNFSTSDKYILPYEGNEFLLGKEVK